MFSPKKNTGSILPLRGLMLFLTACAVVEVVMLCGFLPRFSAVGKIGLSAKVFFVYFFHAVFLTSTLAGACWLVFAACLQVVKSSRGLTALILAASAFVQASAVALIFIDAKSYVGLGVHIYDPFVIRSISNKGVLRELGMSMTIAGLNVALFLGLVGLLFFSLRWFLKVKQFAPLNRMKVIVVAAGFGGVGATSFAVAGHQQQLLSSGAEQAMVTDLMPFFGVLHGSYAVQEPLRFVYPEIDPRLKVTKPKNVLVILAESLRHDFMTPEMMPNVSAFLRAHQCLTSAAHYSNSNTTSYATFGLLSGLYSYHYDYFGESKKNPAGLEILKNSGFLLSGYSASQLWNWQGGLSMLKLFAPYREFAEFDGPGERYKNDEALVAEIESLAPRNDPSRPFFTFVFLVASHWNYTYPKDFEIYGPVAPVNFNSYTEDLSDAKFRDSVRNRYKNAVRFVDASFSRIVSAYGREIESGETAVVLVGDHGEEFWEHGLYGPGVSHFHNERFRTAFFACLPGVPSREVELSSHVDIMPTLLDFLGVDTQKSAALFNGQSLLSPLNPERYVILTGAGFPKDDRSLCVVSRERKWILKKTNAKLNYLTMQGITTASDTPVEDDQREPAFGDLLQTELLRYLAPSDGPVE